MTSLPKTFIGYSSDLPRATLDLNFAGNKSLTDNITSTNLVTFTRASSGTYVAANGFITQAVVNVLLWSESFEQSGWSTTGATITPKSAVGPTGELSASKLVSNAGVSGRKFVYQYCTVTAQKYTYSVYLKAGEFTTATLWFDTTAIVEGSYYPAYILINLATGVSSNPAIVSMTPVGNGWYRCVASATFTTGGVYPIALSIGAPNGGDYVGDGVSGIYIWGAQLETGSTATDYIKTTSTINSAPRFTHDPITGESLGLLVEEQKTNLVPNNTMVGASLSPQLLPTGWGSYLNPSGITFSITGISSQNGLNYVDLRFQGTPSTTGEMTVYVGTIVTAALNQTFTASAYASIVAGSTTNINTISLRIFQLNSGAYVRETSTNILSSLQSTLTRCYATSTIGSGVNQASPCISLFATNTTTPIDITIRVAAPQFESGLTATSVIPTTNAAVTRLADNVYAYIGRTNLLRRSEDLSDSGVWGVIGGGATIVSNATTSPTGTMTADKINETAVTNSFYASQSAAFVAGNEYSLSVYAKKGERDFVILRLPSAAFGVDTSAFFNLNTGVVGTTVNSPSTSIVNVGNGWYRCSIGKTATANSASANLLILISQTDGVTNYAGTAGSGLFVWGAQLEVSQTATSYIATTSLAVTDYADSWYNPNAGCWIGDVYREIVVPVNEYPIVAETTSPTRNAISQFSYLISNISGIYVTNSSVVQAELYPSVTSLRRKIAFGYALDDFFTTANAEAFTTDTAGTPPANVWQLNVGSSSVGTAQLNGTIRRLTYFAKKIANSTAWSLTK